jgi:hypothetical protein
MAICPECDYDELTTADLEEGDEMTCPECGQLLVVTGPDDLRVGGEDDDDDLDDEEEEDENGLQLDDEEVKDDDD